MTSSNSVKSLWHPKLDESSSGFNHIIIVSDLCTRMSKPVKDAKQTEYILGILKRQADQLRTTGQRVVNSKTNDRCAVIVEPRRHPFLEPVIRNVMHFLSTGWNLRVYCGTENESWLRDKLRDWDVRYINMGVKNLNADLHNKMLARRSFWQGIEEEKVLVFQTDSFMLRSGIERFFDYDYIGAFTLNPYEQAPLDPQTTGLTLGMFNGGFSLRNRSAMIECIENVGLKEIDAFRKGRGRDTLPTVKLFGTIAEDIFFVTACSILGKKLPTKETACEFSTEALYNKTSLGLHGLDKTFFDFRLMQEMIAASELAAYRVPLS